jgi:phenylalanyl-tRNA synthetase beta chain
LGFAREIAAILNGKLKENYYHNDFITAYKNRKKEVDLTVTIENPDVCRRYNGIVIKNIEIKESPKWMQRYLIDMGLNPINNIVDMTNYVMMELAQPMHAFDFKKLTTPDIIVRYAKNAEQIKTLDESDLSLLDSHLVIADKEKAIAVAGVMGGNNTKIDDTTTEIILESANFHAATVRRAANKLSIRTDSSNRFEKSQDPENTINAIELAYYLIKETCENAYIASDLVDNYPTKLDTLFIDFTYSDIRNKLGLALNELSDERIKEILTNLHFEFDPTLLNDSARVKVPSFRATKDVSIKADIIEEIGRIYGYDNINPKPFLAEVKPPIINEERLFERNMKNLFVNKYDFNEVMNYSFINEDDIKAFDENPDNYLGLKNYLSTEYTKIRRNLFISALKTAKVNSKNFQIFKFFEVGRGYHLEEKTIDGLATEHRYLIAGQFVQNSNQSKEVFYNMKAIINDLFETLNFKGAMPSIPKDTESFVHPHRALEYKRGRDLIASVYEFDPRFLNKNDVSGRLVVLNLDLDKIYGAKRSSKKFADLQKYPYTNFELTLLANKKDLVSDIFEIVKKSTKKLLKNVELLTIYEGHPIEEDRKAVSIKITLGDDTRTLNSKEIDDSLNNIVAALDKKGFILKR